MDIALCKLIRNGEAARLEYSGANNSLWYFSQGQLHEIKPDKQPVGKHEGRVNFTNHTVSLNKGDMVYLFSDGYADQFGGNGGKKFMVKNLRKALEEIHQLPADQQKQHLADTFKYWMGNLSQVDDVCIVGVRV
jgi:serine phosphatase RsbU (regulator of sigma subunit)